MESLEVKGALAVDSMPAGALDGVQLILVQRVYD